jgi:(E)-4-hydroxy-3-methylbut-2-enyl-diphosphate synthase
MMNRMVSPVRLHKTIGVRVGHLLVGGGAPVVVQSMTMTDTADAAGTAGVATCAAGLGVNRAVTASLAAATTRIPLPMLPRMMARRA